MRSRPGRSYNSHAGLIFPAHPAEGSRRGSGNRALSNRLQDCRGVSDQQERTHPMNMASDVTRVRASRVWLSAVAIALLLVVSNTAPATAQSTATVMVSNLDEAEERRIWLNPGQAYAHSFHTGNTAVTLEKVRLYLRGAESTPAVTIRADNSGQPYRSLQALTNPSIDSLISTPTRTSRRPVMCSLPTPPIGWCSTDNGAASPSALASRYRRLDLIIIGAMSLGPLMIRTPLERMVGRWAKIFSSV